MEPTCEGPGEVLMLVGGGHGWRRRLPGLPLLRLPLILLPRRLLPGTRRLGRRRRRAVAAGLREDLLRHRLRKARRAHGSPVKVRVGQCQRGPVHLGRV